MISSRLFSRLGRRSLLCDRLAAEERPHCEPPPRPDKATKKLAVVTTAYYYLSHAYHICGRFLNGYLRDGKMHYPDFGVAGMYVEQQGASDSEQGTRRASTASRSTPTLRHALTLGGDKLAVDGVLLIGEHGDYPIQRQGAKALSTLRVVPERSSRSSTSPAEVRAGLLRQAPVL